MARITREEAAGYIERFLAGTDGPKEWDWFITVRQKDPDIEKIRVVCAGLPEAYPPLGRGYCGPSGLSVLRQLLHELRRRE